MPAYSVSQPYKFPKFELINRVTNRLAFDGQTFTENQAIKLCAEFPHLAMRPKRLKQAA